MSYESPLFGARYQTPLAVRIDRYGGVFINRAAMDAIGWPEKAIIGVQPPDCMVILPVIQGDHRAYTVQHEPMRRSRNLVAVGGIIRAAAACREAGLVPPDGALSQRYLAILCEDANGRMGLFVRADLTMPDGRRGKRTPIQKTDEVAA